MKFLFLQLLKETWTQESRKFEVECYITTLHRIVGPDEVSIQLLKEIGAQESRKVKVEGHITTTLHRILGTDEVSVYTSVEGDRGPGV